MLVMTSFLTNTVSYQIQSSKSASYTGKCNTFLVEQQIRPCTYFKCQAKQIHIYWCLTAKFQTVGS